MDLRYRPSPIKRSKNSGLSSKSRSGRSRGCRRASACSRARPLAHNPSQARAPQVGVRLTISPSRCAPVPFLHTIYPSPKNNPPPPSLNNRTLHDGSTFRRCRARTHTQNSASQLERTINRWATEVLRRAPAPVAALQEAALTDLSGGGESALFTDARPMMVQSLLRNAMAEAISEGFINCLIVTSSAEANVQLTRIHEHLFARKWCHVHASFI